MDTDNSHNKFEKFFMEPTEKLIAVLGNNYIQHYLADGEIFNGFAVVSDKRVYFKGKSYRTNGKKFYKESEERVVDLKDITGTGYTRKNLTWMLVVSILLAIYAIAVFIAACKQGQTPLDTWSESFANTMQYTFLIAIVTSIGFLIAYRMKRINLFDIEFAGGIGKISFNTAWYDKAEIDDFQRKTRLAKDSLTLEKQQSIIIENTPPSPTGSTAEEIRKYADLLNEGFITQNEYDKLKSKLLS